jgi:hypothetical protein
MGTDNRDFVAIPPELLVEQPGLDDRTVRVGNSDEVTENGDSQWTAQPGRQPNERMGFCDVRVGCSAGAAGKSKKGSSSRSGHGLKGKG